MLSIEFFNYIRLLKIKKITQQDFNVNIPLSKHTALLLIKYIFKYYKVKISSVTNRRLKFYNYIGPNIDIDYSIMVDINGKYHVLSVEMGENILNTNDKTTYIRFFLKLSSFDCLVYSLPFFHYSVDSIHEAQFINLILKKSFSNLQQIYDYILKHNSLINLCTKFIKKNIEKFKECELDMLCGDIKKLLN